MSRTIKKKLLSIFFRNDFPQETERDVQNWLLDSLDSGQADQEMYEIWDELQVKPDKKATAESLREVKQTLGIEHISQETVYSLALRKWTVRIAAVLIPTLLISGVFWYNKRPTPDTFTEISVPNGETRLVEFPDGTRAWVNAGSTLRYPVKFVQERTVQLSGEAFFDVITDSAKPFFIMANTLTIEVLGTQFNVKDYPNEEALVTLKSGKIDVITQSGSQYIMNAGQQLTYDPNTTRSVISDINLSLRNADSWMDGCLVFSETKISDIFSTLERRFNIKVIAPSSILQNSNRYHVIFDQNESLDHILSVLSYLDDTRFDFHIEGQEVIVQDPDKP